MQFTTENFEAEVLQAQGPVLVDFYADWCGPCKMMAPLVERMAEKYAGRIKVGKLNVDESMEIAQKYHVMNIPTFIFFKNGEPAATYVGGMTAADLEAKIEEILV
ncbi:MAG: thioredoxin [Lachnospiraceae bacterium]|nr:thioredoxin [Lachnospiraceae bacterium]